MVQRGSLARLVLLGVAGIVVSACGIGNAGMGLPSQRWGETYAGERQEITGTLFVSDIGCLFLEVDGARLFVIWPAGSSQDDYVRLPNGQVVTRGDRITGTGAYTPTAPRATTSGYWENAVQTCDLGAKELLVLDDAHVLLGSWKSAARHSDRSSRWSRITNTASTRVPVIRVPAAPG